MSTTTFYCLLGLLLIVPDAAADAKLGEACSANTACISGYACDIRDKKCLGTPGHVCTTDTDCVRDAACLNGTCDCRFGYRPFSSGLCGYDNGLRLLGEPCSDKRPCYYDRSGCSDTLTCYVCDQVAYRCATPVSFPCQTLTECVSHSTCDDTSGCVCDSGYTSNDGGLCGADAGGSVGDYCSSQTPCSSGYVCIEHMCYAGMGTACSDSSKCANGTCDSEQKKCLLPQYYRCETSANCVSHATCAAHGHCMCNNGYTQNKIGLCELAVTEQTTSPTSWENSTTAVEGSTTTSVTCPGTEQRNKGLRLTMVWIPNSVCLMTAVLLACF